MQRANQLFDQISAFDNLRVAVAKALRGKRHRADARNFCQSLDEKLLWMSRQIAEGTIRVGSYRQFVIHDPKRRVITAPCFEERVLHHAIMNVCEPVLDRTLIFHTYACRQSKGREACVRQAVKNSRNFSWYVKMDVAKYFDSISHPCLLNLLARKFREDRLLFLFERIICGFSVSPGRGLPIGALTSQHFANYYLASIDRRVTEHSPARAYVRYMDDMIAWSDSYRDAVRILDDVTCSLKRDLKLEIKNSPVINRCTNGISMLGCRVFPGHAVLSRRSKKRFHARLVEIERQFALGTIDEWVLQQRATALTAFARSGGVKSWQFRRNVLYPLVD